MKDIFYIHRLHRRAKDKKGAEIRQISKDSLTNAWDDTKLRVNYTIKVDGGPIQNIMDSKNLFVLFVDCK